MSSPHHPSGPSLAALLLVAAGFCAAHYPAEQPEELRIKFKSKKRFKAPVVAPPGRRDALHLGDDSDEAIPLDGSPHPTGCIRSPGCAVAVVATMLQSRGEPMQAEEILERMGRLEGFREFGLSSVQKALQDLGHLRFVTNQRGKGYRLAE